MFRVRGFQGVGDNFYQIGAVRALAKKHGEIALATPYPVLYKGIPGVKFWFQHSLLRSQEKALSQVPPETWAPVHRKLEPDLRLDYDTQRDFKNNLSIIEAFNRFTPDNVPYNMRYSPESDHVATADVFAKRATSGAYALIRRPTLRIEYKAVSRNPAPGLMQLCVDRLNKLGIACVTVGELSQFEEPQEELHGISKAYEKGEMSVPEVAAFAKAAAITITPVGFATPMCLSVGARCLTVFGGHVPPRLIYGPLADMSKHVYVAPDPFCECHDLTHTTCNKEISHADVLAGLDRALALE